MNIKATMIATVTAAAIAMGTVAPTTATAAPFTPFSAASTEASQVEKVGGRHRRAGRRHHRRHHRHHRHHRRHHGAGVALGLGALALGAAIAGSQARPTRECYVERVRVWSPRAHAYVIRKERVCY